MNQPTNSNPPRQLSERVIYASPQSSSDPRLLRSDLIALPSPQVVLGKGGGGLEVLAFVEFVGGWPQGADGRAELAHTVGPAEGQGGNQIQPATLARIESPIIIDKLHAVPQTKQNKQTKDCQVQTDFSQQPSKEPSPHQSNPIPTSNPPPQSPTSIPASPSETLLEETEKRLGEENALLREALLELIGKLQKYKGQAEEYEQKCIELQTKSKQTITSISNKQLQQLQSSKHQLHKHLHNLQSQLKSKDFQLSSLHQEHSQLTKQLSSCRHSILQLTTNANHMSLKYNTLFESHEKLAKSFELLDKERRELSGSNGELTRQKEELQMQLLVVAEENGQLARALSQMGRDREEERERREAERDRDREKEKEKQKERVNPAELPPTYSSFKTPINSDKKILSLGQDKSARLQQRQKRVTSVRSIRQNLTNSINQSTIITIIDTVQFLMSDIEYYQKDNKKLRQGLEKLTRLLELEKKRPKGQQIKQKNMDVDDQILFQQVVKELQREKMANRELSQQVDNLSQVLLKAQEQLMQKADTINNLIHRPSTSMKSSYHQVQNLRRHLHQFSSVDRRTRSNIIHESDPKDYKGHLERIAREAHQSEISDKEFAISQASRLETKLFAYERSLVPDLERELGKYRRLYDDALYALNEKTAEAEELQTDLEILKGKYLSLQRYAPSSPSMAFKSDSHISAFGMKMQSRIEKLSDKNLSQMLINSHSQTLLQQPPQPQIPPTTPKNNTHNSQNPPPLLLEQPFSRRMPLPDLMRSTQLSCKSISVITQKLLQICLKMVNSKSYPLIKLENIIIVDYDEKDPLAIKVKLIDLDTKAMVSPRARSDTRRFIAPEVVKLAAPSEKSMVWNIGVLVLEIMGSSRVKSMTSLEVKLNSLLMELASRATKPQTSERPTLQEMLKKLEENISTSSNLNSPAS